MPNNTNTLADRLFALIGLSTVQAQFRTIFILVGILVLAMCYQAYSGMSAENHMEMMAAQRSTLVLGGIILVLLALAYFFSLRTQMYRLKILEERLTEVAEGDFTRRLDKVTNSKNELGKIYVSYNQVLDSIGQILSRMTLVSSRVNTQSEVVSVNLEDTARGVSRQQSEIDMVATAMNEMANSISEVSENTNVTHQDVDMAKQKASESVTALDISLGKVRDMAAQVDSSTETISQLAEDSKEIDTVIEVITAIAEQTNLLALNAAIEAARAGEQGRGFAVVADEVRTLARRTQESTTQIRAIIERLQNQSAKAVDIIAQSQESSVQTVEKAVEAKESIDEIYSILERVTDQSAQVAVATEQQTKVANDIDQRMVSIGSIAKRTTLSASDTVESANQIGEELKKISDMMLNFKIDFDGLDLSTAKMAHLNWRSRVRRYLNGEESLTRAELVDHHSCKFGQWYYADGIAEYSHLAEFKAIEPPHAALHEKIKYVVELKEAGREDEAEEAYYEIADISGDILKQLGHLEEKVMN